MKKLLTAVVVAVVLPAAVALAEIKKTHPVQAEIVKVDTAAKAVTFKFEGVEKTAPCSSLCPSQIKALKAGDSVTLTCVDEADAKGCKEITFVKKPVAKRAPAKK